MNLTEDSFNEWLEHPVTLEIKKFLELWKKNIEEGLLNSSFNSNISSEKSKDEFIYFITSNRMRYSVLDGLLSLNFDSLKNSIEEVANG